MNINHAAISGKITGGVNGFIAVGKNSSQRSKYRSMLNEILERIEQRLVVVGLDAQNASLLANLSEDAIRNIQRAVRDGKRAGVSTQTLVSLAPVLQTSASWLLEGSVGGPENVPPKMRPLWHAFTELTDAPEVIQDRVLSFIRFQLSDYENSASDRETATNPVS